MQSEASASQAAPARFGLDTHCLVALLADWHPRHRATVSGYERRLAGGQQPVVACHALLESFAVLTRLPGPVRVPPATAYRALWLALRDRAALCCLAPEDCWEVLSELAGTGRGGGLLYDAAIAVTCFRAGARQLLTWDLRHMRTVAPAGLEVVEP